MSTGVPFLLSPLEVKDLTKSGAASVSLLDATWFMPNAPRNAKEEFLSKRIPGSQFLDLDEVASPHELGLKHMMPDSNTFAQACGGRHTHADALRILTVVPSSEKLGISPSTHVVM